jgi:hypothetical protein
MKIHCYFFLLVLVFSCKEDQISPLVGTWTLLSFDANCTGTPSNSTSTYFCDNNSCIKYIFASDGKIKIDQTSNGASNITDGTYSISGSTVTITLPSSPVPYPQTYTFKVSGVSLSLSNTGTGRCIGTFLLKK